MIVLHCDRCGSKFKEIKTTNPDVLKNLPPKILCKDCEKREKQAYGKLQELHDEFREKLKTVIDEARTVLDEAIKEID